MISLKDLATEKVTVISGPYGSGKTNVAVNLSMDIAKSGQVCRIADLDIVNPYFRSADNAKILESLGVQTMIPTFANTNVDIPA
ncbi:MAG: PhoH family protein, partial [Clostridia bacterium]|nr:PhoH family protein [Clostridia bacterium]